MKRTKIESDRIINNFGKVIVTGAVNDLSPIHSLETKSGRKQRKRIAELKENI